MAAEVLLQPCHTPARRAGCVFTLRAAQLRFLRLAGRGVEARLPLHWCHVMRRLGDLGRRSSRPLQGCSRLLQSLLLRRRCEHLSFRPSCDALQLGDKTSGISHRCSIARTSHRCSISQRCSSRCRLPRRCIWERKTIICMLPTWR